MRIRWMIAAALPLVAGVVGEARQAPAAAAGSADFFETKIRPVLAANCYDCHTDQRMGGLGLDSRDAVLKGGRSGPDVVRGDPHKSLVIAPLPAIGALKVPEHAATKTEDVSAPVDW